MRRKDSRKLVGCLHPGLRDRACDPRRLEKALPCPALSWPLPRGARPGAVERSLSAWSVHHGMARKEDTH